MYECWAWLSTESGTAEWVKGWDVGTATLHYLVHVTVFKTCVHPCCDEHYCEDWQLHYGVDKPTHKAVDYSLIKQTLEAI